MKKKITSLFAMMLMFAGIANAQVEELQGGKTVFISNEAMTLDHIDSEHWYAIFQTRDYGGFDGGYWWDAPESYTNLLSGDKRGEGHLCKTKGNVLDGEPVASDVADCLVRFLPTETAGTFYIQFGTGNYADDNLNATADLDEAAQIRVYNIVTEDGTVNEGHWALNLVAGDKIIDNNGSGNGLSPWGNGNVTTINGNNDHQIFIIDFTEVTEREIAEREVAAAYEEYSQHEFPNTIKGFYGNYDPELVEEFQAALLAANEQGDPDAPELSIDELKALVQRIKDAYDAVIKSQTPYTIEVAEGYYFIKSPMTFTETTEDIDDPETGEIIPGGPVSVTKAMYSEKSASGIKARWATFAETAPFLWKVTSRGDKVYELKNMGTDAKITTPIPNMSDTITRNDSVIFEFNSTTNPEWKNGVINEGDTIRYDIRPAALESRGHTYLHCAGHDSGAGVSGDITGWAPGEGAGASEWMLIPVDAATAEQLIAEYAPIKEESERILDAKNIVADVEGKLAIAEDNSVEISDVPLITSPTQLSSPHTNTNQNEGRLEGMLDGITSGEGLEWYWHSDWSSAVPNGTHYFQVELPDEAPEEIAFEYTRRAVYGNQIVKWGIYGTATNEDIAKEECTPLATIMTPLGTVDETIVSNTFNTGGCKYLRFYCEATDALPGEQKDKGFFHVAEFQLYPAITIINETSQKVAMGEVFTNMQAAVAKAELELEAEESTISIPTYTELKNAYEAFIAMYVNPDTLRNKIKATEGLENYIVIGENPGQWKDASTATNITSALDAAKAYDKAGKYTVANSQAHVSALDAAKENMLEAANPIQEGIWYTFQFASEDLYTANDWDKAGANALTFKDINGGDVDQYPALYGRYVSAGVIETDSVDVWTDEEQSIAGKKAQYFPLPAYLEDLQMDMSLYYVDQGEIDDNEYTDQSRFRFIHVGDSAYLIQNKATGLFLYAAGGSGAVRLSPAASTWNAKAMGFGKVMVYGYNPDGTKLENLHAQRNGNQLVTWAADGIESNTGFMIAPVAEVVENEVINTFNIAMKPNSINNFCFPTEVSLPADAEGDLLGVEIDGSEITLTKLANKTAKAGEPFIYINGDAANYDAEAEAEYVTFLHKNLTEQVANPDTVGKHIGQFYGSYVQKNNIIVTPTQFVVTDGITINADGTKNKDGYWVGAFKSYIKADLEPGTELNVAMGEGIFDSIQETVAKAVKGGNIYTIDGKFVGKGNLSTKLSRGTYIINGVKVIVK